MTLEAVGQRLIRCGEGADGHEAVVPHWLSQLDDGDVIPAQRAQVKRRSAGGESHSCTVTSPQAEFTIPSGMHSDVFHCNVLLTAFPLKQVVLAHHHPVRTGMTGRTREEN